MSTLMSIATGNFTTAGTWALCDVTSENDSEGASTALTTSYVASSTFTPGAITIDGIAIKLASRNVSPTGTISVALDQAGSTVSGTEVTINVSDLDSAGNGWYLFKFASSVTLIAATTYSVKAKTSSSSQVNLFNAGSSNWSRQLRTTSTQAPSAGDKLIVAGEHTGAGTGNSFTVTMDNTATTIFGSTSFLQSISINKRATLAYGTSASTAYYLKVAGFVQVYGAGTFNIATSGTPMPSTSSGVLEFSVSSATDSGLIVSKNGIFTAEGNHITNVSAFLNSDASASATSLTTDISTGWLSGDKIVIASTTRTAGQSEVNALTGNASGTSLPVSAITNAHSGTAPIKAEIINLTRNVKIRGISSSLTAYLFIDTTATVTVNYAEIYNMGSSTNGTRGIDIKTTTGSCSFQYCGIYDFVNGNGIGLNITGTASNNITLAYNGTWNINTIHISLAVTSGTLISITNNISIGNNTNSSIFSILDIGNTFSNNTAVSCQNPNSSAINYSEANTNTGTFNGNTAHSNAGTGIVLGGSAVSGSYLSLTSWRNGTGVNFTALNGKVLVDTAVVFGNGSQNLFTTTPMPSLSELRLRNFTVDSGSTLTCPRGFLITGNNGFIASRLVIENSTFGATTTHSVGDISISDTGTTTRIGLILVNTKLFSSTPIVTITNLMGGSFISEEKSQQVSGVNLTRFAYNDGVIGTIERDATIYDVSPSMKITPADAVLKCESPRFRCAVASGQALSISVKVRESVSGDGADYNGNRLRLVLVANRALGITADVVLATATISSEGAFETLTATTATASEDGVMEFYIDGDGTTGFFNVDTWSVS